MAWLPTTEIALANTFYDWLIMTNRVSENARLINPSANTIQANTITSNTITATGTVTFDAGVATSSLTSDFEFFSLGSFSEFQTSNTDIRGDYLWVTANTNIKNNLLVQGDVTSTGFYYGDGSNLTNLPTGNVTSNTQLSAGVVTTHAIADGAVTEGKLDPSIKLGVPTGTVMLFRQATAPTGWTQLTSSIYDEATIRTRNSASASQGNSTKFSTAFASRTPAGTVTSSLNSLTLNTTAATGSVSTTVSGTTQNKTLNGFNTGYVYLTIAQMPSHYHFLAREQVVSNDVLTSSTYLASETTAGGDTEYDLGRTSSIPNVARSSSTGSGSGHRHTVNLGSHNHGLNATASSSFVGDPHTHTLGSSTITSTFVGTPMDFNVKYIDIIVCQRS